MAFFHCQQKALEFLVLIFKKLKRSQLPDFLPETNQTPATRLPDFLPETNQTPATRLPDFVNLNYLSDSDRIGLHSALLPL